MKTLAELSSFIAQYGVKGFPLVLGLLVNLLLSLLLRRETYLRAEQDAQLVGAKDRDGQGHFALEQLMRWRDLMVALVTGVFVLMLTTVQRIAQDFSMHTTSTLDYGLLFWLTAPFLALLLAVILIIYGKFHWFAGAWRARLWFCILVLPCYMLAFAVSVLQ